MADNRSKREPYRTFASKAVPIDIANCDTDQIIPGRYLRRPDDDPDYASFFLHDLRFNSDGTSKDFIFDREAYQGAEIIVADENWGCGSSRENAVTALAANGIRSVIAPSFADIHYSNCIKNGVLPVRLPAKICDKLRQQMHDGPGGEIAIDLEAQSITGPDQQTYSFEIDAFDKQRLLAGLDDIGLTLEFDDAITAFTKSYKAANSWTN